MELLDLISILENLYSKHTKSETNNLFFDEYSEENGPRYPMPTITTNAYYYEVVLIRALEQITSLLANSDPDSEEYINLYARICIVDSNAETISKIRESILQEVLEKEIIDMDTKELLFDPDVTIGYLIFEDWTFSAIPIINLMEEIAEIFEKKDRVYH